MSSARGAAAHIGRVGSLAVALGIGAAMATGTAWADTADSDSGTSSQRQLGSSPDNGAADSTGPAQRPGRGPAPGRGAPQSDPADPVDTVAPDRLGPDTIPALAESVGQDVPPVAPEDSAPAGRNSPAGNNDTPARTAKPAATVAARADAVAPQALTEIAQVPQTSRIAESVPAAPEKAVEVAVPVITGMLSAVPAPAVAISATAPPAAPPAALAASRALTGLLSAVGLAPLAGNNLPGVPVDSPALWALLGWTRRDAGRLGVRSAAAQAAMPSAAVVVTTPSTLPSTPVGWVTGQRNIAFPGSGWDQTNNTRWADVYGTDLGIMWFNGVNGKTQLAFGDTFAGPNMSGNWRSNVLLLSDDTNLTDGLSLINTGRAYQFIPAARNQVFIIGSEVTNIPTSALYANNQNYVSYMSVKSWDTPGRWTTNYSAVSQYDPATDKWVLQKSTIRSAGWFRAARAYKAGDQNFQQMAYVLQPESKVAAGEPRYVYAFGTPAGRAGSAYLSRVPEGSITNLRQYEYWNGAKWISNQARAEAVLGDSGRSPGLFGWAIDIANNPNFFGGWLAGFTGAKTGGNVSEMSVQYNEYLDKYVVLYGNGANNVILRTADSPEGPWSEPITIATSAQYPGLYAPMIHPLSGTGQLTDSDGEPDDSNLYWNMSVWSNYNVVLMQTDLSALKVSQV